MTETPKPVEKKSSPIKETKAAPAKESTIPVYTPPKIIDLPENSYMPIKALNTFARDWIIKARISNKGDIKTTRNGGHLLKIELVDQYGT